MKTASSHEISPLELVGGKGLHLQKLISWQTTVAPFFIITTKSFDEYLLTGEICSEVKTKMSDFFKSHRSVALRSSMIAEDQVDSSFAGLFETLLNVTEAHWEESLKQIFNSVKSDRVNEYLFRKKIHILLKMAVVVQEQIDVDKSGVIFTRSPVTPTSAVAIDAAYGMGEGVVSGLVPVDHYLYTRSLDKITEIIQNDLPVLNEDEIKKLIHTALHLERTIKMPADIEWGIRDGKLYIFQIRPITRVFKNLACFVDTNLSESYPGSVSPFTAQFVKKAYENVFKESALILGAQGKRFSDLSYHYARLISVVDDHLYYNLEHYYAVLRALPGGEKNITKWHKMIGGNMDQVNIPYYKTELSKIEGLSAMLSFFKNVYFRKKIFKSFLHNLDLNQKKIEEDIAGFKNSSEIVTYIDQLIHRPLGFGLTVINDIYIMLGLNYLTKACAKHGLNENKIIDILKTSDGVDSLKPLECFNALVMELSPRFIEVFDSCELKASIDPYKKVFQDLENLGFSVEVKKMEEFLLLYGDRSFEELKLESLPLKNNPLLFKQLIMWAKDTPEIKQKKIQDKSSFEFNGLDLKVLNFTRDCIAIREAARLWRGKYYHLLRKLVINLALQLQTEDLRWKEFDLFDFFSLNSQEWMAFINHEIDFDYVKNLILTRRGWKGKKKLYPEFIQWQPDEKLPDIKSMIFSGDLVGQGVSPGIVEGQALVLESPDDALQSDLKNFILVTKNTDPAWVYIMSRSLALVSEKGSLLSHTAIIGRELSITTVVGVKAATSSLKTGDRIRVDGTKGTVERL